MSDPTRLTSASARPPDQQHRRRDGGRVDRDQAATDRPLQQRRPGVRLSLQQTLGWLVTLGGLVVIGGHLMH